MRSLILAVIVMVITAILLDDVAMAFRKSFLGSGPLFYAAMSGLMVPGVLLSLGSGFLDAPSWHSCWPGIILGLHSCCSTLPSKFLRSRGVYSFEWWLQEVVCDMGADD